MEFRNGGDSCIAKAVLFLDPVGNRDGHPLAEGRMGCPAVVLRMGQVRAFTEDAGDLGIARQPQPPADHPAVTFARPGSERALDARGQAVAVRAPEVSFRSVCAWIGACVVVNADQDRSGTLAIGHRDAVIQLDESVVVARHHDPKTRFSQPVLEPPCRIEREILSRKAFGMRRPLVPPLSFPPWPGSMRMVRNVPCASRGPRVPTPLQAANPKIISPVSQRALRKHLNTAECNTRV